MNPKVKQNLKQEAKVQGTYFLNAVLFFAFMLVLAGMCERSTETNNEYKEHWQPESGLLIQEIPGELGNIRWRQPSEIELRRILEQDQIRTVIRLNGNGKDAGGMTVEEEAEICAEMGVRFYHINAHEGYVPGEGYLGSAQKVSNLLSAGNTFIHCRHGYDRTGAMVGYYLSLHGWDKVAIIEHNDWNHYLTRKGQAYRKYYETAIAH